MKTHFAVCMALLCVLCFHRTPASLPTSCGTAPYPIEITQPDGSRLTVSAIGNAMIHHTETSDGYTVVKNSPGIYEYAVLTTDGSLAPSGIKAHDPETRRFRERTYLAGTSKHLRISSEQAERQSNRFQRQNRDVFSSTTDHDQARFPSSGTRKALVLLIQYPDLPNQYSTGDFDAYMNEAGYAGTGSFRDYFLKNSYGQLDIQTDVFGWYTAENNYDHYGYLNGFQRARKLMAEAIDAAEAAGVDFSQYDNDGDGVVDAVIGIHAGPGAEMGAQLQYIWSHRWTLGSYERNYDGVTITDYIINPETRPWGMVGVGVICHEFGHVMGLPDLYDADNSSRGIGNWGLMGNGAWLNQESVPSNLNAWCREKLSWLTPEVISEGFFSLENVDGHAACYRINTSDPNEYFLLENRQPTGNDTYLPGNGMAIWHIDSEKTALYPATNNVNADEENKGVDLEEADGLDELDDGLTQGDDGDLFPGSALRTLFGPETTPSSDLYDGSSSGISITNIYESGGVVYFRLNDPVECSIFNVTAGDQLDCENGSFDQELLIHYDDAPETGQLSVNGHTFEIAGSPQTVILPDLEANGSIHGVEAIFTGSPECGLSLDAVFTAPHSYDLVVETTTCDPAEAGEQYYEFQSQDGCDSMVTIITTLLPSYETDIFSSTCSEAEAGTTTLQLTASNGCDSLVNHIVEYIPVLGSTVEATTCDPAEAGTEQIVFQTSGGCDSTVTFITALLESHREIITTFTCDPAEEGSQVFQYIAANGCDSTVVVRSNLVPSYEIEIDAVTCDPEEAGTVSHLYESAFGCDSMVTVQTAYHEMEVSFNAGSDGLELLLQNTSHNADNYLWLFGDGNFYIGEAPSHTFGQGGLYFVLLIAFNAECETFDAFGKWVGVVDDPADDQAENTEGLASDGSKSGVMDVYPNPTFGPLNVATNGFSGSSAIMSLFDINGKLVLNRDLDNINSTVSIDLSGIGPGIYTMRVSDGEQIVNKRVFLTN